MITFPGTEFIATVTKDLLEVVVWCDVGMSLLAILHATSGRVITGNERRSCGAKNSGSSEATLVGWPIVLTLCEKNFTL